MKSLKFKLKDWNKSVFGDVHLKISNAMQQVDSIQQQVYENGYTEALFDLEKNARLELEKALQFQEAFWHENPELSGICKGIGILSFSIELPRLGMLLNR